MKEINRYGMTFVENRSPRTYKSGRRVAAYYRLACARCGWTFAGARHLRHRQADCDAIIAERVRCRLVDDVCKRNLGTTRRREHVRGSSVAHDDRKSC